MAYSKVETLKIGIKSNAFGLKYAMKQINELSINQIKNVA